MMKYISDQLKLVYLCERNGLTDEGVMNALNGKNKLNTEAINSLKECKWSSIFLDQKLNPTTPQYCDGSIVKSKIKDPINFIFIHKKIS